MRMFSNILVSSSRIMILFLFLLASACAYAQIIPEAPELPERPELPEGFPETPLPPNRLPERPGGIAGVGLAKDLVRDISGNINGLISVESQLNDFTINSSSKSLIPLDNTLVDRAVALHFQFDGGSRPVVAYIFPEDEVQGKVLRQGCEFVGNQLSMQVQFEFLGNNNGFVALGKRKKRKKNKFLTKEQRKRRRRRRRRKRRRAKRARQFTATVTARVSEQEAAAFCASAPGNQLQFPVDWRIFEMEDDKISRITAEIPKSFIYSYVALCSDPDNVQKPLAKNQCNPPNTTGIVEVLTLDLEKDDLDFKTCTGVVVAHSRGNEIGDTEVSLGRSRVMTTKECFGEGDLTRIPLVLPLGAKAFKESVENRDFETIDLNQIAKLAPDIALTLARFTDESQARFNEATKVIVNDDGSYSVPQLDLDDFKELDLRFYFEADPESNLIVFETNSYVYADFMNPFDTVKAYEILKEEDSFAKPEGIVVAKFGESEELDTFSVAYDTLYDAEETSPLESFLRSVYFNDGVPPEVFSEDTVLGSFSDSPLQLQGYHYSLNQRKDEAITCYGDAGAPALVLRDGQWLIAGILDWSFDLETFQNGEPFEFGFGECKAGIQDELSEENATPISAIGTDEWTVELYQSPLFFAPE